MMKKISFTWLFKFGRSIEEILSDIQQSDLTLPNIHQAIK